MALRGSGIMSAITSSLTIPFPLGTVAGDLAIVFAGGANWTNPGGWTNQILENGFTWNTLVASKVLTSGDITTGSVTVSASATFNSVCGIVTFVGAPAIREVDSNVWDAGPNYKFVSTSVSIVPTDGMIMWGSHRGGGGTGLDMCCSRGKLLQATGVSGGGADVSAILMSDNLWGSPTTSGVAGFSYFSGTAGQKNVIVVVQTAGLAPFPVSIVGGLAAGTLGVPYSYTFTALNLPPPPPANVEWLVTAGALPTGLSLSTAGVLSGTPTVAASFAFEITVIYGEGAAFPVIGTTFALGPATLPYPFFQSIECSMAIAAAPPSTLMNVFY